MFQVHFRMERGTRICITYMQRRNLFNIYTFATAPRCTHTLHPNDLLLNKVHLSAPGRHTRKRSWGLPRNCVCGGVSLGISGIIYLQPADAKRGLELVTVYCQETARTFHSTSTKAHSYRFVVKFTTMHTHSSTHQYMFHTQ